MPILGIVAAAGGFTKFGDFYQIATSTASGGSVANFTFSSIPQDYTHLQIRFIARGTDSSNQNVKCTFNSDTGSNYSDHFLIGNGSAASSGAATNSTGVIIGLSTDSASTPFGAGICDILDYTNTNKYKTTRSIHGIENNSSGSVRLRSGNWRSTSAITSMIITLEAGNFQQYSSFALYGIKAS